MNERKIMNNYIDKSSFLRGILVIVTKDGKISDEERNFVMKIGKELGFEKTFCHSAINEILDNQFVEMTPPEFSDKNIAEKFIYKGVELAYADSHFHPKEIDYLKETALKNGFTEDWFIEIISSHIEKRK